MGGRVCSVTACNERHYAKGYCQFHWSRARQGREVGAPKQVARSGCSIEGCTRPHWGLGWCRLHLERYRRTGDPRSVKPPTPMPVRSGSTHLQWKGDDVGYFAMHRRLYRVKGRAADHVCVDCGRPAAHWTYDHHDPNEKVSEHGPFSTDPNHYVPRCVSCHNKLDQQKRYSGDDGEVCPQCMAKTLSGGR